jgi:hypothetical protein
MARDADGKFLVTGQVPGDSAVHTPPTSPSAYGPGAWSFTGAGQHRRLFNWLFRPIHRRGASEGSRLEENHGESSARSSSGFDFLLPVEAEGSLFGLVLLMRC